MKVTYDGYLRFKRSYPSYNANSHVIPGDHVELPDNYESFFGDDEITMYPLNPVQAPPLELTEARPQMQASTTDQEQYYNHIKGQIRDIPQLSNPAEAPFVLDLPDVREKVRLKFEAKKRQATEPLQKAERKTNKGRKKCKDCGKYLCKCEKAE